MFYWGRVWFQSWNENVCLAAGFPHVGQKSSFMLQMMGRWWRRCLSLKTTGSQRRSYWRSWQSSRWDVITGLWAMESAKVALMLSNLLYSQSCVWLTLSWWQSRFTLWLTALSFSIRSKNGKNKTMDVVAGSEQLMCLLWLQKRFLPRRRLLPGPP